jgi:hypothetical protein
MLLPKLRRKQISPIEIDQALLDDLRLALRKLGEKDLGQLRPQRDQTFGFRAVAPGLELVSAYARREGLKRGGKPWIQAYQHGERASRP